MAADDFPISKKSRGSPPGRSRPETTAARVPVRTMQAIDGFIARQPEPKPSRPEAIARLVDLGLAADRRQRADAKAEAAKARAADAAQARAEYDRARNEEDARTERLRRVRLAKEEHDRRVAASEQAPPKRSGAALRAKELATGAVKEALSKVDAPDEEKIARKRKLLAPPDPTPIRKRSDDR